MRRGRGPAARPGRAGTRRGRCRWSRSRRGRRWSGVAGTTRCSASAREAAVRLRRRGVDAAVRRLLVSTGPVRDQAALGAGSGPPTCAGAMRCRTRSRAAAGRAAGRGRRHHHGVDRPGGAARARGGGAAGDRRRGGGGHPTTRFGGFPTVRRTGRLTSVYGVRPGPWLRRSKCRARGRAVFGPPRPLRRRSGRQADASRRQSGPRKTSTALRPATVHATAASASVDPRRRSRCGLEVSPASHTPSDTVCPGEKAGSGGEAAEASAGGCGVEDQVGRAGSS